MLLRYITASLKHRKSLYLPMIVAVGVSLALLGASRMVGHSFQSVVDQEMAKYGANVIIKPEDRASIPDGVPVAVAPQYLKGQSVQIATAPLERLLNQNPAWLVRGEGDLLVGQQVATMLDLEEGESITVDGRSRTVAILESGTRFDEFLFRDGSVAQPSMVLLRTENPEQYRGENVVILEEMVRSKYMVLTSIHRLMLIIALIAAVAALATVFNLARLDAGSRRHEFGILKSLGAAHQTIARVVGLEFGILAAVTTCIGFLGSMGLAWIIIKRLSGLAPSVDVLSFVMIALTALLAFGVAGLYYHRTSQQRFAIHDLREH